MNKLIEKNNCSYSLKTEEGRKNLNDYIIKYNENIDPSDPIAKNIGFDEALALCNIEEFIKIKPGIAEIVREALEIGFTCKNFKTNTIFTFTRNKMKKLGYNSLIRLQIENYIKFRLQNTDKNIQEQKANFSFENVTCFKLGDTKYYYNILTGEELTGEELKKYIEYLKIKNNVLAGA